MRVFGRSRPVSARQQTQAQECTGKQGGTWTLAGGKWHVFPSGLPERGKRAFFKSLRGKVIQKGAKSRAGNSRERRNTRRVVPPCVTGEREGKIKGKRGGADCGVTAEGGPGGRSRLTAKRGLPCQCGRTGGDSTGEGVRGEPPFRLVLVAARDK